jgi:hypothetical protein
MAARITIIGLLLGLAVGPTFAQSTNIMSFKGEPPESSLRPFIGTGWLLYASGIIDNDAAERLEHFIEANKVPTHIHSRIYFDSPGGILLACSIRTEIWLHPSFGRNPPISMESPNLGFSECDIPSNHTARQLPYICRTKPKNSLWRMRV